jgi:hypothetical protein
MLQSRTAPHVGPMLYHAVASDPRCSGGSRRARSGECRIKFAIANVTDAGHDMVWEATSTS